MSLIKVEGHDYLYRNESGAIVNMNKKGLAQAKMQKKKREKEKRRIENLEEEVLQLKRMIQTIIDKQ